MIHYQLLCVDGHQFDGWYKDSAAFDRLAAAKLIACPACGGTSVSRALMAPAIRTKRSAAPAEETPPPPPPPSQQPMAVLPAQMPDQVRSALQKLRNEVEKNCDYVGPGFADEARRIHRGETDERGIYGETTPEEAEALADEGITVARIPWVPRADG
jgi:hypothetical protein